MFTGKCLCPQARRPLEAIQSLKGKRETWRQFPQWPLSMGTFAVCIVYVVCVHFRLFRWLNGYGSSPDGSCCILCRLHPSPHVVSCERFLFTLARLKYSKYMSFCGKSWWISKLQTVGASICFQVDDWFSVKWLVFHHFDVFPSNDVKVV